MTAPYSIQLQTVGKYFIGGNMQGGSVFQSIYQACMTIQNWVNKSCVKVISGHTLSGSTQNKPHLLIQASLCRSWRHFALHHFHFVFCSFFCLGCVVLSQFSAPHFIARHATKPSQQIDMLTLFHYACWGSLSSMIHHFYHRVLFLFLLYFSILEFT